MNLDEFTKEKLWLILTDAVHEMVMYPNHKAYIRDVVLREKPDVTPAEIAGRLSMSLGETLVILDELKEPRQPPG